MNCKECGKKLEDETNFCKYCGAEQNEMKNNTKKCPYCNEELEEDALFCEHCGKKINNKRKKKFVLFFFVMIIVISVAILIVSNILRKKEENERKKLEQEKEEIIANYILKCDDLMDEINAAQENLLAIGGSLSRDIQTGGLGYYTTLDDLIAITYSVCAERVSEEETRKITIDNMYEKIVDEYPDYEELDDLKTNIDNLYSVYISQYSLYIDAVFSEYTYYDDHMNLKETYTDTYSNCEDIINPLAEEYSLVEEINAMEE